jgi:hypothetical protein
LATAPDFRSEEVTAMAPLHVTGLLIDPLAGAELVPLPVTGQGLRDLIGGFAEGLTGGARDWVCYVDEDGKVRGDPPPPNPVATALARALGWRGGARGDDYLVGRALFLGRKGTREIGVPGPVVAALAAAGHRVAGYTPIGEAAGQ